MLQRRILRLALNDVLGNDIEDDIIYILKKIKEGLCFDFDICMWYREKQIANDIICKFKSLYIADITLLHINILHLNGYEQFVWYDVINSIDAIELHKFKFRYIYNTYSNLPSSLLEFGSFAKSYSNQNGNRNAKSSVNRFHKVG